MIILVVVLCHHGSVLHTTQLTRSFLDKVDSNKSGQNDMDLNGFIGKVLVKVQFFIGKARYKTDLAIGICNYVDGERRQ